MKAESTDRNGAGKTGMKASTVKEGNLALSGKAPAQVKERDSEDDGMDASSKQAGEPATHCHEDACCCARTTVRNESEKKALINRCNRVEGQIRGIRGMLEKDMYCDDVLNQVAAVRSALDSISRLILERHMKSCLIDRIRAGELQVVDELLGTLQKMMK